MIQTRGTNRLYSVFWISISLICLLGCEKNFKSPDESESEYQQRKNNYYLLDSNREVERIMIKGYGNLAVKRVITLDKSRWVTLDNALEYPESAGFCKTDPRNVKSVNCNLATATTQQSGCNTRGYSHHQCVNLTVANGVLEDKDFIERLKFLSIQPCLTFPRKNQFPRPDIPWGHIYAELIPLNEVFICSRNQGRGIWTFRVALQAEDGNRTMIVPDDFGGKVVTE